MTFHPGDKVICVERPSASDKIVLDKVYEVEAIENGYVILCGDGRRQWSSYRFIHAPAQMCDDNSAILKAFKEAML